MELTTETQRGGNLNLSALCVSVVRLPVEPPFTFHVSRLTLDLFGKAGLAHDRPGSGTLGFFGGHRYHVDHA